MIATAVSIVVLAICTSYLLLSYLARVADRRREMLEEGARVAVAAAQHLVEDRFGRLASVRETGRLDQQDREALNLLHELAASCGREARGI